jgi:hypothetical protein
VTAARTRNRASRRAGAAPPRTGRVESARAFPPHDVTFVACDGLMQFEPSASLVLAQLVLEREFVATAGCCRAARGSVMDATQRMVQHGSDRRDTRPSRHEEHPRMLEGSGKCERPDRAFHIHERPFRRPNPGPPHRPPSRSTAGSYASRPRVPVSRQWSMGDAQCRRVAPSAPPVPHGIQRHARRCRW